MPYIIQLFPPNILYPIEITSGLPLHLESIIKDTEQNIMSSQIENNLQHLQHCFSFLKTMEEDLAYYYGKKHQFATGFANSAQQIRNKYLRKNEG